MMMKPLEKLCVLLQMLDLQKNQPVSEQINNLFNIMSLVSTPETLQYFKDKYNDATIKYSELKIN